MLRESASNFGGIGDVYLQDGYKLIRADELIAALAAVNARRITFRAFRAYLACFELLAIREAAERSSGKLKTRRTRRFLQSEVSKLLDTEEERSVSRELTALRKSGLLAFSESAISMSGAASADFSAELGKRGGKRLIPVPRRVLRFLAACKKPALVKTIIAYLLRGLSLERSGAIRNRGTVKISWICALCQISERAARAARAELIRLGWITKDTGSFQRKLNRDGAYFVINTAWNRVFSRSAPPQAEKCGEFAPPLKRPETLSDSKNQKLGTPEQSGFCGENSLRNSAEFSVSGESSEPHLQQANSGSRPLNRERACASTSTRIAKALKDEGSQEDVGQTSTSIRNLLGQVITKVSFDAHLPQANSASGQVNRSRDRAAPQTQIANSSRAVRILSKPDLRNIRPEDIRKPSRLQELYGQAVKAGWLQDSEANLLNFAAAAVRANRATGDAVRIFVAIVRRKLWRNITADEEAMANAIFKRTDVVRVINRMVFENSAIE